MCHVTCELRRYAVTRVQNRRMYPVSFQTDLRIQFLTLDESVKLRIIWLINWLCDSLKFNWILFRPICLDIFTISLYLIGIYYRVRIPNIFAVTWAGVVHFWLLLWQRRLLEIRQTQIWFTVHCPTSQFRQLWRSWSFTSTSFYFKINYAVACRNFCVFSLRQFSFSLDDV